MFSECLIFAIEPSNTQKRFLIFFFFSGLIGRSFAMLFAAAEYEVWLFDIEKSQLSGALEDIKAQLKELDNLQLLRGSLTAEQQFNNINTTDDIEKCVKDAVFVHVSLFNLSLGFKSRYNNTSHNYGDIPRRRNPRGL